MVLYLKARIVFSLPSINFLPEFLKIWKVKQTLWTIVVPSISFFFSSLCHKSGSELEFRGEMNQKLSIQSELSCCTTELVIMGMKFACMHTFHSWLLPFHSWLPYSLIIDVYAIKLIVCTCCVQHNKTFCHV